ncbi:MAG TPA: hypothetical protein VK022_03405 [Paracoccaceae bacterium]|nr:hypothetical protein [Paracoccaceae bacterium]
MKVFVLSLVIAAALAIIAGMVLQSQQMTVVDAFTTEGARVGDPGDNLIREWR